MVISASDVSVEDAEGRLIAEHDYSGDAAGMVAMLTSAFGIEPAYRAADPTQECGNNDGYRWIEEADGSGLILIDRLSALPAPYTQLDVRLAVPSVNGVAIITSAGFAIGDDVTAFVAALPEAQRDPNGGPFIWEVIATAEASSGVSQPFGGMAQTSVAGVASFIAAPGTASSFYC